MANEANIIKIKRSGTSGAPASLKLGELAYSYLTASGNPTSNGGDRLFIGANGVNSGTGNANDVIVIGGKYFTDMLDHERGVLTASSALIVDANRKLSELLVDDLSLNGSTLSTTITNGDLTIRPDGTGSVLVTSNKASSSTSTGALVVTGGVGIGGDLRVAGVISADSATFASINNTPIGNTTPSTGAFNLLDVDNIRIDGNAITSTDTNGNITVTPNGTGKTVVTNLYIGDTATSLQEYIYDQVGGTITSGNGVDVTFSDVGNTTTLALNTEYAQDLIGAMVSGNSETNITVTYDDPNGKLDFSVATATSSVLGVASFNSSDFTVTSGAVTISNVNLGTQTTGNYAASVAVTAGTGLSITGSAGEGTAFTLAGLDATSSVKGVASFDATDFTVTSGAVTVKEERIQDIVGAMVSSNTESGISVTYDVPNGKLDFNVNDPVITIAGDVDGFATMSNLGDTTITVTLDTVNTNAGTFGSATAIPVVTVNGKGLVTSVTTASISTSLSIAGTSGTDTVALGTDTLTFAGNGAISTAVTNNQVAISVATATSSVLGVASFNSTDFTVATGAVTVNEERIQDIIGAMVDSNIETNASVTYDDTTGKLNFSVATATSSVLGVASFNTASFAVTTGDVTIKSAGVTNAQLVNSSLYIGTTQVTLGDASGTTSSLGVNISGKATTAGTADQVANSITFAVTGGAIAGSTFNGSAARTVDYSTIGAAPAAGSSSIVTVGALTSGSIGVGFTAIPNTALANSKVTVGTTDISLGSSSTTLAGLTQVDVSNIRVAGNTISSTDTNGNINLAPNGTGTIDAGNVRITNLADPTGAQHAATKAYVDAVKTGLDVKGSVRAATTANITLTNTQTIDGVALSVGDRVLVKNQTTTSQNGIYVVASGAWTRATDCDNTPGTEVTSGLFTFVEEGTANADSGWVLTTDGTITLGTTGLSFVQFSGAGQITAGAGLSKTGNTLDVNVANGIEIVGDNVQLASTVAGDGLTYTSGVLAVVGTSNRISVSADAVDISASYIGQSSITTLGTVTTGTWNGGVIGSTYGGTGVNNGANTITIGGNISTGGAVAFSGAYAFTGTLTATTSVTFPTSGTLVNTSVTALSSLATIGTITSGTWNGTAIGYAYGGTGQTTYAKGDFLYASAANTLSKLTAGTNGQTLQLQDGVPFWGDLDGGTY